MLIGGSVSTTAVLIPLVRYLNDPTADPTPPMSFAFAAALIFPVAVTGALEFITGQPLSRISRSWDERKPWQRFLIGTAVVLAGCVGIFATVFVYIEHFHQPGPR